MYLPVLLPPYPPTSPHPHPPPGMFLTAILRLRACYKTHLGVIRVRVRFRFRFRVIVHPILDDLHLLHACVSVGGSERGDEWWR